MVFLAGNRSLIFPPERARVRPERKGGEEREKERVVDYCDRDEEEWRAWVVTSWMRKRCEWRPFSWTSSRGLFFFPPRICLFEVCFY